MLAGTPKNRRQLRNCGKKPRTSKTPFSSFFYRKSSFARFVILFNKTWNHGQGMETYSDDR